MQSLLIIGAGNMGSALARGISLAKDEFDLSIYDIHGKRVGQQVSSLGFKGYTTIPENIHFDIIVVCVKPQDLIEVGKWVRHVTSPTSMIVSILAGQSISGIKKATAHTGPVIRAMPNIAATVLQAATAISFCEKCEAHHERVGEKIFSTIGTVVTVKEELLDAVTGLSGSGPAYIFMTIEALIDGGVKMGLTRAVSHELVVQTLIGSAQMVRETNTHPAILKDQVTTPGGTTIHAIHALESKGLRSILIDAVVTATEQSKALRRD